MFPPLNLGLKPSVGVGFALPTFTLTSGERYDDHPAIGSASRRMMRSPGASMAMTLAELGLARNGGAVSNARAAKGDGRSGGTVPKRLGKEAGPMRKGLFALVLVAASFAGGAAINGPGLAWARALIDKPGRPRPMALVPPSMAGAGGGAETPTSRGEGAPGTDIPDASRSPLVLDAPTLEPAPLSAERPRVEAPKVAETSGLPELKPAGLDDGTPTPVAPAVVPAPPAPKPEPPAKADLAVAKAAGAAAGDWVDLRRRLNAAGVSRYWAEGTPGGPCTFRCVIPTAGGRALAQHFEAEGDDDLRAAEAALRRIALWKATEAP